jgi:hypothetical protein
MAKDAIVWRGAAKSKRPPKGLIGWSLLVGFLIGSSLIRIGIGWSLVIWVFSSILTYIVLNSGGASGAWMEIYRDRVEFSTPEGVRRVFLKEIERITRDPETGAVHWLVNGHSFEGPSGAAFEEGYSRLSTDFDRPLAGFELKASR